MGGAVEDAVDFVGDAIDDVGDFVQDEIIDPISDAGSDIDDFINEEIPGGWGTVAAVVIATTTGIPVEFGSATTAAEVVTASEAAFVAADAAQLAAQGLSQAQIASTIAATGVSEAAAAAAAASATAAAGGSVASGIPVSAGGGLVEAPIAAEVTGAAGGTAGGTATVPSMFEGAVSNAVTGAPSTTGAFGPVGTAGFGTALPSAAEVAAGLEAGGFSAGTASALAGQTAAGTGATGLLGGATSQIIGTAGGLSIDSLGRAFNQAGQLVQQFSSSDVGRLLGSAAESIVNNNTLQANADALRNLGAQTAQQANAIGAAANVPFTPYTVTSGLGTSTVSPTGATTTAAGPYAALQQQALGLSGAALGAINPAQASQTLFGQLEGLQGPARQREQEALLSRLGARGLLGFGQNQAVVGGGVGTVNPYMESLLSAQATQQAQNALAAQQFGTQEAARQQAIAQALQTQGLQVDQQTLNQLDLAGRQGLGLQQLALTGAGNQARAGLTGLTLQTEANLGAYGQDALRRQQVAQAVNQNIGNLGTNVGGMLTGAGNLISGATSLGNTVSNLFTTPSYTPSVYEANMGVNFLAPGLFG